MIKQQQNQQNQKNISAAIKKVLIKLTTKQKAVTIGNQQNNILKMKINKLIKKSLEKNSTASNPATDSSSTDTTVKK